ncbi:acetoin dehydrogenase E2 subunit dihydrolipoyllysine-residue acetyltransferase [Thalassovita gelatinovora]|uniref:Acetoin dehydrogenase E2 subunit dihydrolipoyllysine-residue acetyltransferase n=1 Tax=Thalassovita gelatinovora TaxID=53501 RepID=A0A0P1F8D4_THAGE|nr:alpha/beta fold hydrolase [Thalassovita gelatinovora]QIZ80372.1 alpha/beta fold hydrolase [Thalassovita gelatinovora]CUH64331.1 acetoin dehydrogenase E2 subunit dihydrolipoyllysine-residue acetyltransferase [Thalassovita gelatinovora]SEQ93202.1 Pimeloyl-ACP methyl ester carboxylesterase [Thalassovita gelatinovora]
MADFLLVHGAGHGAWCWRDVIPELAALGHRARAIDLPGHGEDNTPYQQVTLDLYADAIVAALDRPMIVVGHSMGGYPITLAADRNPLNFLQLIYLCAYVPQPGLSLADMRKQAPSQPLLPAIRRTQDRQGWTVDPTRIRDLFYHDCPAETVGYAGSKLCIQATQPTSVSVETGDNYANIPKHYIICTDDRTIPPEYQREMTRHWPRPDVSTLDSGHSPFFADPAGLAKRLDQIAQG